MKTYLNYEDKVRLINNVVGSSVINGELDVLQKELSKVLYITLAYVGDGQFVKDGEGNLLASETYDSLMEKNYYYKEIQSKLPTHEYRTIERLINEAITEELRKTNTITSALNKMADVDVQSAVQELKKLDMDKLAEVTRIAEINNTSTK